MPDDTVMDKNAMDVDAKDQDAINQDGGPESGGSENGSEQPEAGFLPPLPEDEGLRILEAILFATADPLPTSALRNRMPDNADVGGLLMTLQERYEGRGVNLVELEGHWAFRTAPDLKEALELEKQETRKLSRAAMEIMAIIAYHQPVTRAEIENIRGVSTSKGTLDILIEAGWVKPGRRRQTPGRPLTWKTTTAFLDHFGLESMTDLPGLDELKAAGLLDRRPAIETVTMTGELFEDDEEPENEELSEDEEDLKDDALENEANRADIDSDADTAYEEESGAADDHGFDYDDRADDYDDDYDDNFDDNFDDDEIQED